MQQGDPGWIWNREEYLFILHLHIIVALLLVSDIVTEELLPTSGWLLLWATVITVCNSIACFSSNFAQMLILMQGWTHYILEVKGQGQQSLLWANSKIAIQIKATDNRKH